MKIVFLGSSHGVPEPNRKCACAMIEVQGRYYFVDMGVMAITDLVTRGIPVDAVKGVFLTHMHGDHTNGLLHFVDLCTWYFKTADPLICLPDIGVKRVIEDWLTATLTKPREIRYQEITDGVFYDDGFLKVTAVSTQHCARSHAFLLEADGKAVLFTGDLKNPGVDFPSALLQERPVDLIVCESAHFEATDYAPVLKDCACPSVCVTHFQPHLFPGILKLKELLADKKVFPANDGMEIVL